MIFMYHNVVADDALEGHNQQGITLRATAFKNQIKWLSKVFNFVTYEEYLNTWKEKGRQPILKAVITFDDGTSSTYEQGISFLMAEKIPSVVFINTCQLDEGDLIWAAAINALCFESIYESITIAEVEYPLSNIESRHLAKNQLFQIAKDSGKPSQTVSAWLKRYPLPKTVFKEYMGLSSKQLVEMSNSGFVEIAAHTHSHPFLSELTRSDQKKEIDDNISILEKATNRKVNLLAYPSGDYNEDTISICKEIGLKYGFAVHRTKNPQDLWYEIPRIGIYSGSVLKVLLKAIIDITRR